MSRVSSIGVVSTKGGVGKSTVGGHVAIAADGEGRSVLVLDGDQAQNSLHVWAKALRGDRPPVIRKSTAETIEAQLAAAGDEGFDLVIVDVPPGGGQMVSLVASIVDFVLVPVRATTFDLHAMRNTVDLLRATADNTEPTEIACRNALGKAWIVLNAAPNRPSAAWMEDLRGALAQCGAGGLEIIGTLSDRAAYSASLAKGLGVTEQRDAKAIEEVTALYREITTLERKRANAVRKARSRK